MFLSPFLFKFEENEENYLLFNALNFSLIRIKRSVFDEIVRNLENIETCKNDEEIRSALEELKKRDFLLDFEVNNTLKQNMLEHIYFSRRARNDVLSLWLSLTSICNMACPYCYLSKKPGRRMSNEEAEAIIKFVENKFRENKNLSNLSIVYFGGEPLLNKQILMKLHMFFCELTKRMNVSYFPAIITNGTLLDSTMIQELKDIEKGYNVAIKFQITIDGTKEIHDRRRPLKNGEGSFDIIYSNFINLTKSIDNMGSVTLRSNLDYNSIEGVKMLFYRLKEDLGPHINKISVGLAWTYPSQDYYLKTQVCTLFPNKNQALKLLEVYKYLKNIGFKLSPTILTTGPCGVTAPYNYSIDESLKVYKCPGLLYTDRYFGIIREDGSLEITNSNNLVKYVGDLNKCYLNCKFGALCYGGCRVMKHCPKEYFETFISKEGIKLFV